MKHYEYKTQGTCSRGISFDLDENNKIIEPYTKVNQVQTNRITKSSKKVIKMNNNSIYNNPSF
jgi:hypothetical protein